MAFWVRLGWAASGESQSLSVLGFIWEWSLQRVRGGGLVSEAAPLLGTPLGAALPPHKCPPEPLHLLTPKETEAQVAQTQSGPSSWDPGL